MHNKKLNILLIILVSILTAVFVFYKFNLIPKNLSFDEVEFAKLALSLDKKPYIPYSQLATGHSTLYFYSLLGSLKNFGINSFALRFPAAFFGILSIFLFYLIIGKLKNFELKVKGFNLLPFALSIILLTSRWFINFSRFSFEVTFLLFLELTSIYFLLKFEDVKKTKTNTFLILSGIFAGLSFLSYTPGRIFFILPLSFIILSFPRRRESNDSGSPIRSRMTLMLCFLIPFIIVITPLTSYLMTHKDTRIDQQFFLNNHEMPVTEKLTGLWQNISSTALMFNVKGDVNGRHNYPNKPALNPLLGILFIIGLFISIKNLKNGYNKLFVFYFLLSLLPAIMTYSWENPNMLRTYTTLPSVVYFIGSAIIFFINFLNKKIKVKKYRYIIYIIICLVFVLSSFYELRTYFKYQSIVFDQAFEIKLPLEKAIKAKNP